MILKDYFLDEAKIGSNVELMVGDRTIRGEIISIDNSIIRIRKSNGLEPVIMLDQMVYYEFLPDDYKDEAPQAAVSDDAPKAVIEETKPVQNGKFIQREKLVQGDEPAQDEELRVTVDAYLHQGKYKQASALVEKKFMDNPGSKELAQLLQKVGRIEANASKYRYLSKDNSDYANAMREWRIYENISLAKEFFLKSIAKREEKYFSALMNYVSMVMENDGVDAAINTLISYKDSIRQSDQVSRIKYYEKLSSLYLQAKDYNKLLQTLNALKGIYRSRLNYVENNKNRAKYTSVILRIARCQAYKKNYEQSIETAKQAIAEGHSLYACVNQMVYCYTIQNDFESAREITRQYMEQDPKLEIIMNNIDNLEAESLSGENSEQPSGMPVGDNDFISFYEGQCEYEGLSEEKKISRDFTDEDLHKIDSEIRYASRTKPKDRADYNLTAACIEKKLNEKSDKYYFYIASSLLYKGNLLLANKEFDRAKSCYLAAVDMSQMSGEKGYIETDAICYYMYAVLKEPKTYSYGETIKFESTVMLLIQQLSDLIGQDNSALLDIIRLLNASGQLKELFIKNASQDIFYRILSKIGTFVGCDQTNDQLWAKIGERNKKSEGLFNEWYTEVQLDKNFDHDYHEIENKAASVKNSLLVTELDQRYIDEYLICYRNIDEYRDYSDFDNRMRILNQGKNALEDLKNKGHNGPTLFFENYMQKIITATIENLAGIVSRTGEDYEPELSINVPITTIPADNGKIRLSVTISNAENKATARNISLCITDVEDNILCCGPIENTNLKGGAETSELIEIPIGSETAFTLKLILNYEDDDNKKHRVDTQISISTNVEDFEAIKNPYITGQPVVSDDMFFGRDDLVQGLVDKLCDDRIRCIVIYGQKRTGKSSIFNHLKKKLTDSFIVLSFSIGGDITNELNFYRSIKNELIEYFEDYKKEFGSDVIEEFDRCEINDFIDFEQFIKRFNRYIAKPLHKELLLMIDEFTFIYSFINDPDCEMSANFMDKWKAMIEENLFKSALIGQDNMPDFIQEYANQFQVTKPVLVSYLKEKDAIELVTEPIAMENGESRFVEDSEKMIVDWFNGQPYYLQYYCSKLTDYLNDVQKQNLITAAVAKKVKDDMLGEVDISFFDNLVQREEKDLIDVLLKIAKASDIPGFKVHLDKLDISEKDQAALEKLAKRGVIDYQKSEQKCSIKIPFFHEWLMKEY